MAKPPLKPEKKETINLLAFGHGQATTLDAQSNRLLFNNHFFSLETQASRNLLEHPHILQKLCYYLFQSELTSSNTHAGGKNIKRADQDFLKPASLVKKNGY